MLDQAAAPAGLFGRTRSALVNAWRDLVGAARLKLAGAWRPDLPDEDQKQLREQIEDCLAARGGEVSARARAAELGAAYLELNDTGRGRFLGLLAREYGLDRKAIETKLAALNAAGDGAALAVAARELRQALQPPRIKFLRQFSALGEGIKFLIDLRADVYRLAKKDPALSPLDGELRDLLASWFDIGLLELRRIAWDSPAALLEKLIAYEAVHEIRSWADLKNRLDSDRRCYAFFHPRMPNEPLIFIEVALVQGMADNVQELLDERAPRQNPKAADTAIFYSISNAQRGLAGVSFGGFLIKQVVDDLAHEFPNLKVFATLSPIPGFLSWLRAEIEAGRPVLEMPEANELAALHGSNDGDKALLAILNEPGWPEDLAKTAALKPILTRLCARYLLEERHGKTALDRVAHFHLSNGARVERLNWAADRSAKGLAQSAGLMVNYRYKLDEIDANHEAYTAEGASPPLRACADCSKIFPERTRITYCFNVSFVTSAECCGVPRERFLRPGCESTGARRSRP
jgi:malonyl-CoA decarboxylase